MNNNDIRAGPRFGTMTDDDASVLIAFLSVGLYLAH
jgi:hypothetical protein